MPTSRTQAYACARCAHVWLPRGAALPKHCPNCKSPYWRCGRTREGGRTARPSPRLGEYAEPAANGHAMPIVKVEAFQCNRCAHTWLPRSFPKLEPPQNCPHCKSPYWNAERSRTRSAAVAKPRRKRV